MTRPKLYGIFIDEWLELNRRRLLSMNHNEATAAKLNELNDAGFNQIAIDFLQNLAKAIYKEQAGNSAVRYVHRDDKETWKANFFGPDEEITLLRQSSPLTCVENLHSFIHRISNALDTESSFTSTNFLANNLERNAESDGSVSSDDEFEDAQEYLLEDSLERITQDKPQKSFGIRSEERKVSVSERLTFEDKNYKIIEESSWFRRAVSGVGAVAIRAGALVVGVVHRAASGAGHAAYSALEMVGIVRRRTVQVTYHENFGVQWEEHETVVSERFTYEGKTYETFETDEEIEEIVEETEAVAIIGREQEIFTQDE
ncbi:hypothetical protein BGZ88_005902, partial [Linnemannia elongata]